MPRGTPTIAVGPVALQHVASIPLAGHRREFLNGLDARWILSGISRMGSARTAPSWTHLLTLQARKTGFGTLFVARQTPWLEPSTKDWPYIVVLALAGIEIQPETRIGIPIASTASVGFDLLKECV